MAEWTQERHELIRNELVTNCCIDGVYGDCNAIIEDMLAEIERRGGIITGLEAAAAPAPAAKKKVLVSAYDLIDGLELRLAKLETEAADKQDPLPGKSLDELPTPRDLLGLYSENGPEPEPASKPIDVYLAVPYSGTPEQQQARFEAINVRAAELIREGKIVFSPISHSHPITTRNDLPRDFEFWQRYDFVFLGCSASLEVLQLPGWKESKGVTAEIDHAVALGIPVLYQPEHPAPSQPPNEPEPDAGPEGLLSEDDLETAYLAIKDAGAPATGQMVFTHIRAQAATIKEQATELESLGGCVRRGNMTYNGQYRELERLRERLDEYKVTVQEQVGDITEWEVRTRKIQNELGEKGRSLDRVNALNTNQAATIKEQAEKIKQLGKWSCRGLGAILCDDEIEGLLSEAGESSALKIRGHFSAQNSVLEEQATELERLRGQSKNRQAIIDAMVTQW